MRLLFKLAFALTLGTGIAISAQAQTAPSADEINFAKQKYQIAQSVFQASEKCSATTNMNMNDVVIATAKLSAKEYGEFLTSNGQTEFVNQIDGGLQNGLKKVSCNTLRQNADVKSYIANMSFLINETLFALSLSGLTECGDFSKSSIQKLMAEADKIAASMPQRPDWAFIKSMAAARSEVLTELCTGF